MSAGAALCVCVRYNSAPSASSINSDSLPVRLIIDDEPGRLIDLSETRSAAMNAQF